MSIRVTSRASTANLVRLDQVKRALGVTASTFDTTISETISSVSIDMSLALGRSAREHLGRQAYVEGFGSFRTSRLTLSRWPVDPDSLNVTYRGITMTGWTFEPAGTLFRRAGWGIVSDYFVGDGYSSDGYAYQLPGSDPEEMVSVGYIGGYVLPDQITDWSAGMSVVAGDWVRSARNASPWLFEATAVTGVTGGSVPTWPDTTGSTVVDGGVTWATRNAQELPPNVSLFAQQVVRDLFLQRDRDSSLVEADEEGFREIYMRKNTEPLPPHVVQKLASLRYQI